MRAVVVLLVLLAGCQVRVDANTRPTTAQATRRVSPGPTPKVGGNHETIELGEGKFEGDLVVGGNHNTVTGAGFGKTVIEGRLFMTGNHNTVSGLTIEGGGTIEGNHNDATKAQFHGDVTTSGNKNQ